MGRPLEKEMSSEETTTEVTRIEQPAYKDMSLALPEAEARAKLMKAILPQLVAVCYDNNILDLGGKPYINNDGCQKIARISGISFGRPRIVVSTENLPPEPEELYEDSGKIKKKAKPARTAYIVMMEGEASLLGQEITEFGGASSEDGWFDRPHESFTETRLEIHKKAMANWQGRCVRTLLGLQGLSWDDLEKVGFKLGKGGGVEYREGRHSGSDKSDGKEAADDMRKKVSQQIYADVSENAEAARYVLEKVSGFQGRDGWVNGKTDVQKISDKAIAVLWGKIKPDGKEREKYDQAVIEAKEKFGLFAESGTGDMPW